MWHQYVTQLAMLTKTGNPLSSPHIHDCDRKYSSWLKNCSHGAIVTATFLTQQICSTGYQRKWSFGIITAMTH